MDMIEWAENEVRLACKRENPNRKEGEFDYGCACYESALKAYKSLGEDGHSGYSFDITRGILIRLMNGDPLTPIEDTPDVWGEGRRYGDNEYTTYQCARKSSLFKDVYDDGTVKYHDVDRVRCYYPGNPDIPWSNGFISNIVHEMYPITMPYGGDGLYKVYCEDFLYDPKNGDFDTLGILSIKLPSGDVVYINRYFREGNKTWEEIDEAEYMVRKKHRKDQ